MSGLNRFLTISRKDKRSNGSSNSKVTSNQFYGLFSPDDEQAAESKKSADKDEDKKIKAVIQRLKDKGISTVKEPQIVYALRSKYAGGDTEKAFELLNILEDSVEGLIREPDGSTRLLGAENRGNVTCYLDALLFAMFARLESFEAILFPTFDDDPRKQLAMILRLWVNMLRSGKLITVDITKHLQEALKACGWEEAAELCQQDASEAFTFITGKLELPLLTLKMDIHHEGKENNDDDHKFINERLLEVAILPEKPNPDEEGPLKLEDCLEAYFNNRIEVKRYLNRRNTLQQGVMSKAEEAGFSIETSKGQTMHIETIELSATPTSETSSPLMERASTPRLSAPPMRPTSGRTRADSIFSERYVQVHDKRKPDDAMSVASGSTPRKASLRKEVEVLMPAWQFFSLIPWYTRNAPSNDAQVAQHFEKQRPMLGICLKRYFTNTNGKPSRLATYVDIPLEMRLPHFISDDKIEEQGPLFGNFKLVLQSVVCHRGFSVDSGHYIALVRGRASNAATSATTIGDVNGAAEANTETKWMRFDDLAKERVVYVDIHEALRDELPYLLFYQVQPIDEELAAKGDPPPYTEADESMPATEDPSQEDLAEHTEPNTVDPSVESGIDRINWRRSNSIDIPNTSSKRGRSSMSIDRRLSSTLVETEEGSVHGSIGTATDVGFSNPTTPADESRESFLQAVSRRGSMIMRSGTKSRPSSKSGENRLALTMSKITGRKSKDKLSGTEETLTQPVSGGSGGTVDTNSSSIEIVTPDMPIPGLHAGTKQTPTPGYSPTRSKKGKEKEKKKRSKSRHLVPGEHGHADRECVVM